MLELEERSSAVFDRSFCMRSPTGWDFWEPFACARRGTGVNAIIGSQAARPNTVIVADAHGRNNALDEHTMTADFSTVYAEYRDRLIRALAMSIGDDGLAGEAVDEAFTRALHRWHIVGSFAEPQAWVYRTARNWTMSRFRRRRRDIKFAPKVARPEALDIEPADPAIAAALAGLTQEHRDVLVLRYYLDWPVSAVADALEVAPGTVKSRTSRALNELNRLLGET